MRTQFEEDYWEVIRYMKHVLRSIRVGGYSWKTVARIFHYACLQLEEEETRKLYPQEHPSVGNLQQKLDVNAKREAAEKYLKEKKEKDNDDKK